MSRIWMPVAALAFLVAVGTPSARACDDGTDQTVAKLKKLDLSTEQMKSIFSLQNEHKAVIAKAHKEGLGCRVHEDHQAVFEKAAFGVLDDAQFKKVAGRERTEVESLRYQNHMLKAEVERLKAELAEFKKKNA